MSLCSSYYISEDNSPLQRMRNQSPTTIVKLVDPEFCSIKHLRETKKARISLTNFEKLIKPTPFQKFQPNVSSSQLIISRTSSSPLPVRKGLKSEASIMFHFRSKERGKTTSATQRVDLFKKTKE